MLFIGVAQIQVQIAVYVNATCASSRQCQLVVKCCFAASSLEATRLHFGCSEPKLKLSVGLRLQQLYEAGPDQ